MNKIKNKECIICEKIYPYKTEAGKSSGRSIINYRGKNSFTCSRKCTKIYDKISRHVRRVLKDKLGAKK